MTNRRKLKTYKFKSAKIEIYVDESIGYKDILKVGNYEVREKTIIPRSYFMKISIRHISVTNVADQLSALKSNYFMLTSKNSLRKANDN